MVKLSNATKAKVKKNEKKENENGEHFRTV